MTQATKIARSPRTLKGIAAGMALVLSAGLAMAEAPASTLKKIAETGEIRIGYSTEDFPFSYREADGTVSGYSTELCARVVDHLKQKLAVEKIDISFVERTPRNRVAMLRDGDIDIECVASTNNAERRKSVAFSYPHFITGTQFVSLKKNEINTIADLAGHTVTATSGTTNIAQLNAVNRERSLNIAVMPVETHKDAFKLVTEGRASAFVMDGILLAAMVARSEDPSAYSLSSDALGWPEPYGLMVRLEDEEFRGVINEALAQIYASGEITAIYEKWFTQPAGPAQINLRMPMSAEVQKAFAAPADPTD